MSIKALINECHQNALSKGWWDTDDQGVERSFGDQIALMHSELSEALEEFRTHGLEVPAMFRFAPGSDKPEGIAVEFADVIIRIFDTCGRYNIPLYEAMVEKIAYNSRRPYRHGGKKL